MDGEILATQLPEAVPKFVTNAIGARAIGFFVTTEDGSHPANRIVTGGGDGGIPTADYSLERLPPAQAEHHAATADFTRRPLHAGLAGVDRYLGVAGSAHALGSMVTGTDPRASVVDPHGKVHGMAGLYVGDGSVMACSSRVNRALTIYAWGLRLGDHLAARAARAARRMTPIMPCRAGSRSPGARSGRRAAPDLPPARGRRGCGTASPAGAGRSDAAC